MKIVTEENTDSYEEEVPGALANKVNYLVELTANGKIQLAQNGIALGAINNQMSAADPVRPVRHLGKDGTVKVIQSGAIVPGGRVILDTANPGKVKALPAVAGTYRSLGIKQSPAENGTPNGAGGDTIVIIDEPETVIVASVDSLTALNFTAGGATGAEVAALRDAVKAILQSHGLMA